MYHVLSRNLIDNQVNDVVDNVLKFDSNSSLDIPIRYPIPVVTISLRVVKKYINTATGGPTCM